MRISLLTKFFLSFLVTGAVLVAVLVSLIQFYGGKNFSDYVAAKETRQTSALVQVLEEAYGREGSWEFLAQNHHEWQHLLQTAGILPMNTPPPLPEFSGRPPNRIAAFGEIPERPPFPPPWERPGDLGPRIALLNRGRTMVMGRPLTRYNLLQPVMNKNIVVGYLGVSSPPNLSHPLDLEFLKQQKKIFFMAGGLFLVCSVLVSVALAFHLLSPIRKLSQATREVQKRHFNTRVSLKTRDELGQLAEEFNRMARTLEDYENRQVQWLSDISHELRTPLTILKGELEAVQDGVRPLKPETVDALHNEVGHLIRLVSDLHDLSMAEAQMMPPTLVKVDLSALLTRMLDQFHPRAEQRGLSAEFNIDPGLRTRGDHDRLTQLFSNLLENALRYTDIPGKVLVQGYSAGDTLVVIVENSGPGVPPHLMPRLFDRLFRVDEARNRQTGGSGLGLAICRQIARAHQGKIQARKSPLGGIIVEVLLPAALKNGGDKE